MLKRLKNTNTDMTNKFDRDTGYGTPSYTHR